MDPVRTKRKIRIQPADRVRCESATHVAQRRQPGQAAAGGHDDFCFHAQARLDSAFHAHRAAEGARGKITEARWVESARATVEREWLRACEVDAPLAFDRSPGRVRSDALERQLLAVVARIEHNPLVCLRQLAADPLDRVGDIGFQPARKRRVDERGVHAPQIDGLHIELPPAAHRVEVECATARQRAGVLQRCDEGVEREFATGQYIAGFHAPDRQARLVDRPGRAVF